MSTLRALMVDVDGVVIVPPPGGWAATMEADLGLPAATLQARFFKPHWNDVVLGRAGLHERLAPHKQYLEKHVADLRSATIRKGAQRASNRFVPSRYFHGCQATFRPLAGELRS